MAFWGLHLFREKSCIHYSPDDAFKAGAPGFGLHYQL